MFFCLSGRVRREEESIAAETEARQTRKGREREFFFFKKETATVWTGNGSQVKEDERLEGVEDDKGEDERVKEGRGEEEEEEE